MCNKKGFTLIELLVVVLIIGILAGIAMPQYQAAVKRSQLADYISMVKALKNAEEIYFLTHGEYTAALSALDISLPSSCEYYEDSYCSVYECGESWYGVCNNVSNVQAGTKEFTKNKLRYLQFLKDNDNMDGAEYHMGDIVCMAITPAERKACMSLGKYEIVSGGSSSTEIRYRYIR